MSEIRDKVVRGLKEVGDLRDGFLVGVGTLYILGYVIWAYNAWRNNLGLLPALDFQYFIAGIVPAFYLLALYFFIKGIYLLRKKVKDHLVPNAIGWKLILRRAILVVIISSFLGIVVKIYFENAIPESMINVIVFIFVGSSFFYPPIQIIVKN